MSITRWIARRLSLAALALLACGALERATAQSSQPPEVDVYVYADLSKSVFAPDAQNVRAVDRLADLVRQAVQQPLIRPGIQGIAPRNLLSAGSNFSFYVFGGAKTTTANGCTGHVRLQTPAVSDDPVSAELVAYTGTEQSVVDAAEATDFACVFRHIATNAHIEQSQRAGRLPLIIVASDFLQDVTNASTNDAKAGICDTRDNILGGGWPTNVKEEVERFIAQLAPAQVGGRTTLAPVLALAHVPYPSPPNWPTPSKNASWTYNDCAIALTRGTAPDFIPALAGTIAGATGARTLSLAADPAALATDLAEVVLSAIEETPRLEVIAQPRLAPDGRLSVRLRVSNRSPLSDMQLNEAYASVGGKETRIPLGARVVPAGRAAQDLGELTFELGNGDAVGISIGIRYRAGVDTRTVGPIEILPQRVDGPGVVVQQVSPLPVDSSRRYGITARVRSGGNGTWQLAGAALEDAQGVRLALDFDFNVPLRDGQDLRFKTSRQPQTGDRLILSVLRVNAPGAAAFELGALPLTVAAAQPLNISGAAAFLLQKDFNDDDPRLTLEGIPRPNDGYLAFGGVAAVLGSEDIRFRLRNEVELPDNGGRMEFRRADFIPHGRLNDLFAALKAENSVSISLIQASADLETAPKTPLIAVGALKSENFDLTCPSSDVSDSWRWAMEDGGTPLLTLWVKDMTEMNKSAPRISEALVAGVPVKVEAVQDANPTQFKIKIPFRGELLRLKRSRGEGAISIQLRDKGRNPLCGADGFAIPAFHANERRTGLQFELGSGKRLHDPDGFSLRLIHRSDFQYFTLAPLAKIVRPGAQGEVIGDLDVEVSGNPHPQHEGEVYITAGFPAEVTVRQRDRSLAATDLNGAQIEFRVLPSGEPFRVDIAPDFFDGLEGVVARLDPEVPGLLLDAQSADVFTVGTVIVAPQAGLGGEVRLQTADEVSFSGPGSWRIPITPQAEEWGRIFRAGEAHACILRAEIETAADCGTGGGRWKELSDFPPAPLLEETRPEPLPGGRGYRANIANRGPYPVALSAYSAWSAFDEEIGFALSGGPALLMPGATAKYDWTFADPASVALAERAIRFWTRDVENQRRHPLDLSPLRIEFVEATMVRHDFAWRNLSSLFSLLAFWNDAEKRIPHDILVGTILLSRDSLPVPQDPRLSLALDMEGGATGRSPFNRIALSEALPTENGLMVRYVAEVAHGMPATLKATVKTPESSVGGDLAVSDEREKSADDHGFDHWRFWNRMFLIGAIVGVTFFAVTVLRRRSGGFGLAVLGISILCLGLAVWQAAFYTPVLLSVFMALPIGVTEGVGVVTVLTIPLLIWRRYRRGPGWPSFRRMDWPRQGLLGLGAALGLCLVLGLGFLIWGNATDALSHPRACDLRVASQAHWLELMQGEPCREGGSR